MTIRTVRAVAQHRDERPSRGGVAGVQDVVKVTHPQQRCNISRVRVRKERVREEDYTAQVL